MSETVIETPVVQTKQLKRIERDENSLIKDVEYKFTDEGLVDWRAMIPNKFLYVNNDTKIRARIEKKYGKSYFDIDPTKDNVSDGDLVIMLGGIKYLAKLRGYNRVSYIIKEATENYAGVNCQIEFIPNYETEQQVILFEDNACAHYNNTNGFGRNYLLEMATNRAFCRCVRNFLNINIVSKEELGANNEEASSEPVVDTTKQVNLLNDIMEKKHVTWEHLVPKLKHEGRYVDTWKSTKDLPKEILFEYIERLKKAKL